MAITERPWSPGATRRWDELDRHSVNAIRCMAIDGVERARSGHPGLPLGAAPMAYVLFSSFLRHNPADPSWADRDRFVLSAGHGSMLLYSLLHLTGYDLPLAELRRFRQWGSKTPGHPERGLTTGVEATTGPLGQGIANAVGMAIAERMLAHRFNRPGYPIVDHRTFALVGDGDLMEGVALEAVSLAGHLGLGKLICLYDSNQVSLDGPTRLAFTEDVGARFKACGWQVLRVADGDDDLEAIASALESGIADETRPTMIEVRTTIGFGSPNKAGSSAAHGAPLGAEEVLLTKRALGWPDLAPFEVPPAVAGRLRRALIRGLRAQGNWETRFREYSFQYQEPAREWRRRFSGELPAGWESEMPRFDLGVEVATRHAGGKCLQALARGLPELVGGDADLSSSTSTRMEDDGDFEAREGTGRNLHFGVREHAMGAISNGIAYHGGFRPFAATFFAFADYMRPPIRLAALGRLPVTYVFTHDSIALGEDGPTHQPVEHLASLRAVPDLVVLRPADANETAVAWRAALERRDGPTALILSRQKLPVLDPDAVGLGPTRGAYVLAEAAGGAPQVLLMASGSEVHVALVARRRLEQDGVPTRVVSVPSWELFEAQPPEYRELVLPDDIWSRVAVEAGVRMGWDRYLGKGGRMVGLDRFGASAPGPELMRELGITVDSVVTAAHEVLAGAQMQGEATR